MAINISLGLQLSVSVSEYLQEGRHMWGKREGILRERLSRSVLAALGDPEERAFYGNSNVAVSRMDYCQRGLRRAAHVGAEARGAGKRSREEEHAINRRTSFRAFPVLSCPLHSFPAESRRRIYFVSLSPRPLSVSPSPAVS